VRNRYHCHTIGFSTEAESEIGPLISRRQHEKVLGYIASVRSEGARLAVGGDVPSNPKLSRGNFVCPTIFDGVKPTMR
jgi:acyl-CoA reductase-like NAD-dependent aldehyde dehydrogenase